MKPRGDDRAVVALVAVMCVLTMLGYVSAIPHDARPAAAAAGAAGGSAAPVAHRPPVPRMTVDLSVTVWPHGPSGRHASWSITCPPMTRACRRAIARRADLRAERPGPCPAAGRLGAAEAIVNGDLAGRPVSAWLDQRDTCGAERWRALRALVTRPVARPTGQGPDGDRR